ncbi:helix-turn-helix domain-containing protein [Streptomyces sp. NPDC058637]|uniref:helix-turn-helix domain-containing protein n=1 Tax=Streptomyces sp. NPDC058637 TaxID=3346569 RepID=UPI00364F1F20
MPDDRVHASRRAIGDRMRAARLHANLSQEQVAIGAGIRIATYSNIEQGHSSPCSTPSAGSPTRPAPNSPTSYSHDPVCGQGVGAGRRRGALHRRRPRRRLLRQRGTLIRRRLRIAGPVLALHPDPASRQPVDTQRREQIDTARVAADRAGTAQEVDAGHRGADTVDRCGPAGLARGDGSRALGGRQGMPSVLVVG